jgi:hypothetical protein
MGHQATRAPYAHNVRPRRAVFRSLAVFLFIASCGGCGSSRASSSVSVHSTAQSSSRTVSATEASPAPRGTGEASPAPATSETAFGAPMPAPRAQPTRSSAALAGAPNALLPATFTIESGGALNPSSVASPAYVRIRLTIVSRDGARHRVVLRTPTSHLLTVPPHGNASITIAGLRAGRYPLEVDGIARGALIVGVQPGP